jgi:hypothetical protein
VRREKEYKDVTAKDAKKRDKKITELLPISICTYTEKPRLLDDTPDKSFERHVRGIGRRRLLTTDDTNHTDKRPYPGAYTDHPWSDLIFYFLTLNNILK